MDNSRLKGVDSLAHWLIKVEPTLSCLQKLILNIKTQIGYK